jgi:hypothetical protein
MPFVNPSLPPPERRSRSTERPRRNENAPRSAPRSPGPRMSLRGEHEASSRRSSTPTRRWARRGRVGSNSPTPTRPRSLRCRTIQLRSMPLHFWRQGKSHSSEGGDPWQRAHEAGQEAIREMAALRAQGEAFRYRHGCEAIGSATSCATADLQRAAMGPICL